MIIAKTTVSIFGKEIINPTYQATGGIGIAVLFLSVIVIAGSNRCINEEKIRKEDDIGEIVNRGWPPYRTLTDFGKKLRKVGFSGMTIAVGISFVAYYFG